MNEEHRDQRGLVEALIGDGRPLLALMAICLLLCGGFAWFQSATGHFLPHDAAYLGMDARQLCASNQCRVVHFMFHDRVAFGGVLIALGILYLWLVKFPLRRGQPWAWWTFTISGVFGFGSFLTYIGYGYLDTWHGMATLLLLPCYVGGLTRCRRLRCPATSVNSLLLPSGAFSWRYRVGLGRVLLLVTGIGLAAAGLTISVVGATRVFVPQDLKYLGVSPADLQAINERLIPLIAHDRAAFGGALMTCGIVWVCCVWCGTPSRSLWEALGMAGSVGFAAAIGIHWIVGYIDFVHLAPALSGALIFACGMWLSFPKPREVR